MREKVIFGSLVSCFVLGLVYLKRKVFDKVAKEKLEKDKDADQ